MHSCRPHIGTSSNSYSKLAEFRTLLLSSFSRSFLSALMSKPSSTEMTVHGVRHDAALRNQVG